MRTRRPKRSDAVRISGPSVFQSISVFFERVLDRHASGHLVGDRLSYADLSLFQVVSGLDYAFPRAMEALEPDIGHVRAVAARVAELPDIAAYLASERRLAFNEHGIFRRYLELDG